MIVHDFIYACQFDSAQRLLMTHHLRKKMSQGIFIIDNVSGYYLLRKKLN